MRVLSHAKPISMLILGFFSMLYGTIIFGQQPTITASGAGLCNSNNAVRQGQSLILTADITGLNLGGASCTSPSFSYQWKKNGTTITSTINNSLTISSFSLADIGSYSVAVTQTSTTAPCVNATLASPSTAFFVLSPNPNLAISVPINAICTDAEMLGGTSFQSTVFTSNTCNNCSSYEWFCDTGSVIGINLSTNAANISLNRNSFPTIPATDSIQLYFTATDIYGCVWQSSKENINFIGRPFTAYTLPTPTQLPMAAVIAINTGVQWISPYPTGLSPTYNLTAGDGLVSGLMFYSSTAGSNTIELSTAEKGCVYTAQNQLDVSPSTNISYKNISVAGTAHAGTINNNVEACANDIIEFSYTAMTPQARYARLAAQGGGYIVSQLLICDSTTRVANTFIGATTPLARDSIGNVRSVLSTNIGLHDTLAKKIRVLVPNSAATGAVCFYGSDPTVAGASMLGCISQPGNLTVNNPEVGFALVKQPMCYTDEALLIGIPAGGVFTAMQAGLNLDTTGGRLIRRQGSFGAIDTNFIRVDTLGRSFLIGRAINTIAALNDGGQMLQINYQFQPKYTNGVACGVAITVVDSLPVFDNRPVSFGFPLVEYAPNAVPISLGARVSSISPILNGGDTSATTRFANLSTDLVFAGTFVRARQDTVGRYDFLAAQAGIGRHDISLTINNNGCAIAGTGKIDLVPKPEFVNLPVALCKRVGLVSFQRDADLYPRTYWDTVITCTPITTTQAATSMNIPPTKSMSIANLPSAIHVDTNSFSFNSSTNNSNYKVTLRSLFTCKPTRVIYTEANQFIALTILNATRDTILSQSSLASSHPNINHPSVINFTNPNNTLAENFSILFNHAIFSPRQLVTVQATFKTKTTTYIVDSVSSTVPYTVLRIRQDSSRQIDSSYRYIIQNVALINQATIRIDSLPTTFCYNAASLNVSSTPAYEPGFSRFTVRQIVPVDSTNRIDTLVENILDIQALSQGSTVNKIYEITYKYTKFFGCDTIGKDTFTIIAKQPTFFTGATIGNNSFLCINSTEELLNGSPSPNSGLGGVFTGAGIGIDNRGQVIVNSLGDTVRNVFAPAVAGRGGHNITYTYTDLYGCQSTGSRLITVRNKPMVQLQLAQGSSTTVCANQTALSLIGTPDTNFVRGTGRYFGPTIIGNNIFRPNLAYLLDSTAASGGVSVYYSYRDTFGCIDTASMEISVQPLPILQLNNLGVRYCQNAAILTNVTAIDLTGVAYSSAQFRGRGLLGNSSFAAPQARIANYSPTLAGSSLASIGQTAGGLDTVWYSHTNIYGCKDSIFRVVQIDSTPRPIINNLSNFYCINTTPIPLSGSPSGSAGVFSGAGVSNNSGIYSFSPNIAASSAGVNQNIILNYSFTDSRSCVGITRDTTKILALPTATITTPSSFCENAPAYTIIRQLGANISQYRFSGGALSDTVAGVISPPLGVQRRGYGLDTVILFVTDSAGCQNSISRSFALNPKPNVVITGIDSLQLVCSNSQIFNIAGFPSGTTGLMSSNIPASTNAFNLVSSSSATIQPNAALVGSLYTINYQYTDVNQCSDTTQKRIRFLSPPTPNISQLDSQYCENPMLLNIVGTPAGSTNFFSGAGISFDTAASQWQFNPFRAGSGQHVISYTASNNNGIICTSSISKIVKVRPLPVPTITSISNNTAFCNTDAHIRLSGTISNLPTFTDSIFIGAGVRDSQIYRVINVAPFGNVLIADTIFFFDPQRANIGSNRVSFIATNSFGCVDSISHNFTVFASPATDFSLDTAFCESAPNVVLLGTPATGVFTLRGNILAGGLYRPNPLYPTQILSAPRRDTILYSVNTGGVCNSFARKITTVYPVPQLNFVAINQYGDTTLRSCLNRDTLALLPNLLGGSFSGSGVLFNGRQFLPNIAGVGRHRVEYTYTDSITSCSNNTSQFFNVYGTPVLDFEAIGGCGSQAISLKTDNNILGLNGFFAGALYDSITNISWTFGDGQTRQQLPLSNYNNFIDTIQHLYPNAGIYNVILQVENRGYCASSDSLRVVVSPQTSPTANLPYIENFELNNGNWLEESEIGNQSSDLWNWGAATGARINSNRDGYGKLWATNRQNSYGQNASGWVYSPCFDLTQLTRPMISLDFFSDTDEGNDGVVIEYFDAQQNSWRPLGAVGRGINWYDNNVIAGRPGVQDLAPIGWSGELRTWQNARLPLDDFKTRRDFRFRVAFGAVGVHNRGLEGFAFDNVWIGDRQRNVLVEHFANASFSNMENINQHVYNLFFHTPSVRDATVIQYQMAIPGYDEHNNLFPTPAAARTLKYGLNQPARAIINGNSQNSSLSLQLTPFHIEADMLASPKFSISIDALQIVGNNLSFTANIVANEDMDFGDYVVYTAIVEDSVSYTSSQNLQIHSVVREMLPNASGLQMPSTWAQGDAQSISLDWEFNPSICAPTRLQAVVFIQNQITSEIYQVACSRDISIFLQGLGVEISPNTTIQHAEANTARLYPNPADNSFAVDFETPLNHSYRWQVTDALGRVLASEKTSLGQQRIEVYSQLWAAGLYYFTLHGDGFLLHRKVIIQR